MSYTKVRVLVPSMQRLREVAYITRWLLDRDAMPDKAKHMLAQDAGSMAREIIFLTTCRRIVLL